SRALTWGSVTISVTSLTGAAGTPAAISVLTISALDRADVHAWITPATASRRSRRAAAVANCGSRARTAGPVTRHKRRQIASLAPATMATYPSRAGYTPELDPPNDTWPARVNTSPPTV